MKKIVLFLGFILITANLYAGDIVQYEKNSGKIIQTAFIKGEPDEEKLNQYRTTQYNALYSPNTVDILTQKVVNNEIVNKTQEELNQEKKEIDDYNKEKKKQKKNAVDKLKALGLTDSEIEALK